MEVKSATDGEGNLKTLFFFFSSFQLPTMRTVVIISRYRRKHKMPTKIALLLRPCAIHSLGSRIKPFPIGSSTATDREMRRDNITYTDDSLDFHRHGNSSSRIDVDLYIYCTEYGRGFYRELLHGPPRVARRLAYPATAAATVGCIQPNNQPLSSVLVDGVLMSTFSRPLDSHSHLNLR